MAWSIRGSGHGGAGNPPDPRRRVLRHRHRGRQAHHHDRRPGARRALAMPHHPAHDHPPRPAPRPRPRRSPSQPGDLVFFGDSITAEDPGFVGVMRQALDHTRADLRLRVLCRRAGRHRARPRGAAPRRARRASGLGRHLHRRQRLPARPGRPRPALDAYRALIRASGGGGDAHPDDHPDHRPRRRTRHPRPSPYNAAIDALAAREGLPLLDLHRAFYDVYTAPPTTSNPSRLPPTDSTPTARASPDRADHPDATRPAAQVMALPCASVM